MTDASAVSSGLRRRDFWGLWASRAILVFAFSISAGFVLTEVTIYLRGGTVKPDFPVFWTAARYALSRPEILYDPQAITALQAPIVGPGLGLHPFAYPPTSLLLFGPFGLLPYPVAATLWAVLSCLCFGAAAQRLVGTSAALAAFVAPPVVSCLLNLQVSLILGAGIMLGVALLGRKPIIAGVLIGMVALVKPQVVMLFPVAAIAMGSWRPLAGFAMAGGIGALATLRLADRLWCDWLHGIAGFQAIAAQLGLMKRSVTPNAIAILLGLPQPVEAGLQLAGVVLGVVTCWMAFQYRDEVTRLVGLAAGSLLCAPYAMYHELAVLVPALVMIGMSERRWRHLAMLPVVAVYGMFTLPLAAVLTLVDRCEGDARRGDAGFPATSP